MSNELITLGTSTSTGGKVISSSSNMLVNGQKVTLIGDIATCACGSKSCRGQGPIIQGSSRDISNDGVMFAHKNDPVDTGCGTCFLLASSHQVQLGTLTGQSISIGGNGSEISFGNGVNMNTVPVDKSALSIASAHGSSAASSMNKPTIDPKNAYWPPYDFTAPEEEKRIEVIYKSKVAKIAIFTQEEWKALFKAWDLKGDILTVKDTVTGLYDVKKTAQALGGIGVTAIVKEIDGVEYLYLNNYDKFEQTLLHGGIFRADNAQVVKMGLGALDSVKGMTRYVKVNSLADFLVGSGINGLKYLLEDDYTLRELGVDEAKIFVNAVAVAGISFGVVTIVGLVTPVTVVVGLSSLVLSSLIVWGVDKVSDFERILVETVIDEFDEN
ncbi:TPA: PAAR domain-containing protein [Photobacterium damselae]